MTGDITDLISRLKTVLPAKWFPDQTPILDAVLTGLAQAWAAIYEMLATVRLQSRIATASGSFLDGASTDFFGTTLLRRVLEPDAAFQLRIKRELVRERATRAALVSVVYDLTGIDPMIFEAARPADTGGYNTAALGYGVAGAWGSLALPFQVFVTVARPPTEGIATIAGYGTAGPLARANLSIVTGQLTDSDIYAAIMSVMPASTIAWTRIIN